MIIPSPNCHQKYFVPTKVPTQAGWSADGPFPASINALDDALGRILGDMA
jgi:hypothetical protein